MRERSNCSGVVFEVAQAHSRWHPIALRLPTSFRLPEDAASKGVPAPRALGHDAHYSTTLLTTPRAVTEYSLSTGVPHQQRNRYSEPY
jgi:hypothetical protein